MSTPTPTANRIAPELAATTGPMSPEHDCAYSGAVVLEVMEEARNYNAWLAGLISRYAKAAATVVDLGAGRGTTAAVVRDAGMRVICVEPDARLREEIRSQDLDAHSSLDGLAPHSADLIYSLNVLEHVDDPVALLRQARQALKPGGTLLIYVPAFMILYSSFDRAVGHLRRYTRRSLGDEIEAAGFIISKNAYMDSVGFLAALAFKMLRPNSTHLDRRMLIIYDRAIWPVSRFLDRAFGSLFGKNVLVIATPLPSPGTEGRR